MSAGYAPMNQYWAQGFAAREGRPATQADWIAYQDQLRRGGVPETTSADRALPFAGAAGTLGGAAAAYYAPEIYRSIVGPAAAQVGTEVATQTAGNIAANTATQTAGNIAANTATQTAANAAANTATGAAGTAATAGSSAVGTSGYGITVPGSMGTGAASSGAAAYGPYLQGAGGLLGAYGLYNTVDKSYAHRQRGKDLAMTAGSGAASGAAIGSSIDAMTGGATMGAGTTIGAIIGSLIGLGSGWAGSDKDAHQMTRDFMRDQMEKAGIYEHHPVTDEKFSMGADGGYRFDDGRRAYEIVKGQAIGDPEREYTEEEGRIVGALNPMGWILAGGADRDDIKIKAAGNSVGLLYNELAENGAEGISDDEIRDLYSRAGLDHASAFETLNYLRSRGLLTEDEQRAGHNALNELYGSEYYTPEDTTDVRARVGQIVERLYGE
jgi:hypothetical protein